MAVKSGLARPLTASNDDPCLFVWSIYMAAAQTFIDAFEVGCVSIVPGGARGSAAPSGPLHLVHGWEPLCGGERVRFIFPGRGVDVADACPDCAAAAMPRQRTAETPRTPARTTTAARSRAKAV